MPPGLPRELAPGLHWLGGCLEVNSHDRLLHVSHSLYLVTGERCSALVEGGHPQDVAANEAELAALLQDAPELRYVFATHTETPHTGIFGRLLERYPSVEICGDVTDLHLVFPAHEDRLRPLCPGDALDLGGTRLVAVDAVVRDQRPTLWAFDTQRRVLFTSDGFAYSHYHEAGQCALVAEEAPSLDIPDMAALFAELALYWTRFTDLEPYMARLEKLLFDDLDVSVIAPTHGLPSVAPSVTVPRLRAGLAQVGRSGCVLSGDR